MNKDRFSAYLRNPKGLDNKSLPDLQEIVKEFPYFQTAHLLLAKNYHNENSIRYDNQLKLAAAYAVDRVALYKLINNIKDEALIPEDLIGEPILESLIVDEIERREPIAPAKEEVKPVVVKEEKREEEPKPKLVEPVKTIEEKPKIEPVKEIEPEPQKPSFDVAAKHSFVDWLKYASAQPLEEKGQQKAKPAEKEPKEKKKEFFSAPTMAKKSVEEDISLVTETLAKIYALQGNTEKAIKAYQQLSLKYPEKSSYFAARIKKLEETKD